MTAVPPRLARFFEPDSVSQQLSRRLAEEGHRAYLVGGSVRDAFLDRARPESDIDIATDARPEVIERAVTDAAVAAKFDRAIELCQRALEIDPTCEPLERQLLRLYRLTGSHAAAEEQYRHYAAVMRDDLGITAPPLSEL